MVAADLRYILLATVNAVTAKVSEGLWFSGRRGPVVGRFQTATLCHRHLEFQHALPKSLHLGGGPAFRQLPLC